MRREKSAGCDLNISSVRYKVLLGTVGATFGDCERDAVINKRGM